MEFWQTFWAIFCGVGLLSFVVLVVAIIPLGAIELKEFFATLEAEQDRLHDE